MTANKSGLLGRASLLALAACMSCASQARVDRKERAIEGDVASQMEALAAGQPGSTTLPFSVGMDFGAGLDVVSQEVLSQAKCVDMTGPGSELESQAYFNEISKYQLARDKTELRHLLDISARLSGTVGVIRLGIEAHYYDEVIRNDDSLYILVQYDVLTRSYGPRAPVMTLDGFDGKDGRADNRSGGVAGTIRSHFVNDYDTFRRKCGDYYLNRVVTGGRYIAVLEIKTTTSYDKNLIAGELEGTYLPYMITVRGGLEVMLEDLKTNHEVRVHVVSRGDNRADSVVSLSDLQEPNSDQVSELMDDIRRFREAVVAGDKEASQSPNGYRQAAMYGVFASYEPTAHEIQQGGYPADQVEAMRTYAQAFEQYEAVEHDAQDVLLRPDRYTGADDLAVELIQREAQLSQKALELASQRCALTSNPVCRPVEALGLRTVNSLRLGLPGKQAPRARNCREIRELFGDHSDGQKQVYLGGRLDRPYVLSCQGMSGDAPEDYLPLKKFDPPNQSQTPSTNYARALGGVDSKGVSWPDATTLYSKLRVHVNDDHLVVVPGQTVGVSDPSGAVPSVDKQVPWGSARSCQKGAKLAAVADLSGTPFVLAPDIQHQVRERSRWISSEGKTWFEALEYARQMGGTLLHVANAGEQEQARSLLDTRGLSSAWLGLINSRTAVSEFSWADGLVTSYRNWAAGFPRARVNEQACGWLERDGYFREGSCRDQRPVIVELRQVHFDVQRESPASLRLSVDARSGCGTVEPNPELVLRYAK